MLFYSLCTDTVAVSLRDMDKNVSNVLLNKSGIDLIGGQKYFWLPKYVLGYYTFIAGCPMGVQFICCWVFFWVGYY